MAKVEESVWLNAKPEEVWPFIVEPEKKRQWLTEIHKQEWIDEGPALSSSTMLTVNSVEGSALSRAEGPAGVRTRFHVEKEIRGEVRRYDCVIERWEENRRFDFTAEASGFSRLQAKWTLVPEGEGCRVTMREQINVQEANWLVDRLFVQPSARRAVRGFLAQLKRLVESDVAQ